MAPCENIKTQLKHKIWDGQLFTRYVSEELQKAINIYHFLPNLKVNF